MDKKNQNPAPSPAPQPGQGPTPGQAPAADPAAIAADILATAPKPSPGYAAHMLGQAEEPPTGPAAPEGDEPDRDKDGYIFDRQFVRVGRDGQPVKTPGGLWEMRKDKDGKRYKRAEVLKKRLYRRRQKLEQIEEPALNLPPDLDPAGEAGQPAASGFEAGPAAPPDPRQVNAHILAGAVDNLFWATAHAYAAPAAVQRAKSMLSAPGIEAMSAGMATLDGLENLPWYAGALLIYGQAVPMMLMAPESASKRTGLKTWLAGKWIAWKDRRRSGKIRPYQSAQEPERVQEIR